MGAFAQVELAVQVNEPAAPDWDPTAAHEEVSGLIVSLSLASTTKNVQEEVIRTCVPFLQPDTSMWESIYRNELTIHVVVTRAGLMQLLATDRPLLPVEDRPAPAPLTLHYTAKRSIADSFVYGHAELPICADCEREEPFAQSARDILEPRT